eukprot:44691-Pleurochrysis_carterae.AAC.1
MRCACGFCTEFDPELGSGIRLQKYSRIFFPEFHRDLAKTYVQYKCVWPQFNYCSLSFDCKPRAVNEASTAHFAIRQRPGRNMPRI